jgi:UV DNA damage repair endonuclease
MYEYVCTQMENRMINDWHNLHITDKTGKEFLKTVASPLATESEIRNLKKHISAAKSNPKAYKFLDIPTAKIVMDGSDYDTSPDIDIDAMLKELGL